MSRQRYPEEFKIEAVKQVTEKGKTVADKSSVSKTMSSKPNCASFAQNSSA